jgi:hypothetical protein
MSSNLSSIGFPITSKLDFIALARTVARHGTVQPVAGGAYVYWTPGDGPELWVQLGPRGELNGMQPHYAGEARMKLRLLESLRSDSQTALDGAFRAQSNDGPAFAFHSPNFFLTNADLGDREVQLSAFAQTLSIFSKESVYEQANVRGTQVETFKPDSELKSGMSLVRFSGRILEADQRINPLYNHLYHRALVQTVGGTIDVVCADGLVGQPLLKGGVVQGKFWLSGRLLD